jgi:hypothetical protein
MGCDSLGLPARTYVRLSAMRLGLPFGLRVSAMFDRIQVGHRAQNRGSFEDGSIHR